MRLALIIRLIIQLTPAATAFLSAWYWMRSAKQGRAPVLPRPGQSVIEAFGAAARWNQRAAFFSGVTALLTGLAIVLSAFGLP